MILSLMTFSRHGVDMSLHIFLFLLAALCGVLIGYWLAARRSRQFKRQMVNKVNTLSLDLLDAKTEISKLQKNATEKASTNNLLKVALTRLRKSNRLISLLEKQRDDNNEKHLAQLARLHDRAVASRDVAAKAVNVARRATTHLARLEKISSVTQTIEAPEPKSYGNSDPVSVSVMDHPRVDGAKESIAHVSNRDSAVLSKLRSSNEASAL